MRSCRGGVLVRAFATLCVLAAGAVGCKDKAAEAPAASGSGAAPGPAAAPKAQPAPATLEIAAVTGDVSVADPDAPYWATQPRYTITMLAQPAVAPRPATTTTASVEVAAVHDANYVAFLLRWPDREKSEGGRLGEFSDGFALEFPIQDAQSTSVMMGSKGKPVQLFHWRAQYQHDAEVGKPDVKALYPNGSIDMYAMDFKEAAGGTPAQKESFSPGRVAGNPQAFAKSGLDEIIAEGYSTSAVQEGGSGRARAVWRDGHWHLAIVRPITIEGGSNLRAAPSAAVAFAAWQGGEAEVGSRKCVTMTWLPLALR